MEISVAQFLVQLDVGLFIIDCNPNMNASLIAERIVPLVHYIRQHGHATTPIAITEGTPYGFEWTIPDSTPLANRSGNGAKNAVLRGKFQELLHDPVANSGPLYYTRTEELFATDLGMTSGVDSMLVDPTVGGTHLTDLGMWKQAS